MFSVSSSASDIIATRAVPAATTPAIANATQPIGPSATFKAVPNAVIAGIATVVTNVTPAIPATTTPRPTPMAVIAFVTAGCSFKNLPTPFTRSAKPLEILLIVGSTAFVNAELMLLLACVHFWSSVCAVVAVFASVPSAASSEPVKLSTVIAPLLIAFAMSTPALLPKVSTARAVASAALSMFAISLITDCKAVSAFKPSSEKFFTAVRIAVIAVVPLMPYSSN